MAINIPFFTPSSNDQSLYYLGQIFGPMGSILTPDRAPLIFGQMFNTLNTIILAVGVLIIVYVTVVGVIKTAHEGEPLGKQWSTLWLPIRMVMGIAALIPSTSGYSFLQILIMWTVVQGIGAADSIWATVLNYSNTFGSLTAKVSTTAGLQAGTDMQTLFQMMVCQETATFSGSGHYTVPGTTSGGRGGYCVDERSDCNGFGNCFDSNGVRSSCVSSGNDSVIQFGPGVTGACGKMTVCNPNRACSDTSPAGQIGCVACTAQNEALAKILGYETVSAPINGSNETFAAFGQVAREFVATDFNYRKYYDEGGAPPEVLKEYCDPESNLKCCGKVRLDPGNSCMLSDAGLSSDDITGSSGPTKITVFTLYWPYLMKQIPDLNALFIQNAAAYYTSTIDTAVKNKIREITTGSTSSTMNNTGLQDALNNGWMYAGVFYYSLSNYNNANQVASSPTMQVVGSDPATALSSANNTLYGYRSNYTAAGYLVEYITQQARATSSNGGSGGANFSSQNVSFPSEVGGLSKISNSFSGFGSLVMNTFIDIFTGSESGATNPLVSLQSFGYGMMIAIQVIFSVVLVTMVTLGILGYTNASALGTSVENPVGPVLTLLSIVFTPLGSMMLGGLFVFAALLAIYTPLIPFIIFTIGVLAWFILVIEAVIAGPLVALGLLLPGGQSELFGRAESALMF